MQLDTEEMTLGERLKLLRNNNGWTGSDLAAQLGITKGAVSQFENDKNEPSTEMMFRIAKLYNTTVDRLMYGDDSDFAKESASVKAFEDFINQRDAEESRDSARLVGVFDSDLFRQVKIVRHKVWASFVDSFDDFSFEDIEETFPVYLPDLSGPVTDKHMVFEILGDSMETTLMERAKVLAELVDDGNIEYLSAGVYIVAYRNKLVTKRIIDNNLLIDGTLTLHSDNQIRGKITIRRDDIRYVWLVTDIIGSKVR